MARCDKRASFALLLSAFHCLLHGASAVTYDVSPSGGGLDLAEAMTLAEAGDVVSLADGTYDVAVVSHRDGTKGSPITVEGGPGAIIKGDYSSRSVLITHSFITLKGFSVQGKIGSSNSMEDYINKCVYVEGTGDSSSPLDGFVMEGLSIENCGGECVRLKDSVVNAVVAGNDIKNCGIHDYQFDTGDKNGEGVYIGTSSTQWWNGPDDCVNNVVRGNRISTSGNECVDIKEGATGNVVEDNTCSNQLDVESGCYDSRGDGNTFRYNVGFDCMGAGVRLGGWEVDGHQYGVGNSVYGNDFSAVGHGALKVLVSEQGDICGNTCEDGSCTLTGEGLGGITESWDQACGDVGGPSTSSFTPPASPSTSSSSSSSPPPLPSSSSSRSSSSPPSSSSGGENGDGSATETDDSSETDETTATSDTTSASPQSEGGQDDDGGGGGDDDDDDDDNDDAIDESEGDGYGTDEEHDDEVPEYEDDDEEEETPEEIDEEKEKEKEDEVADEERRERERQEEEEEEEEDTFTTTTDSDDYGNDYGDDFDGDYDDDDDQDETDDTQPSTITSDSDDYGNDHGDDFDGDDNNRRRRARRMLRGVVVGGRN